MERRDFGRIIMMTGASIMLKNGIAEAIATSIPQETLPKPLDGTHSVEICLNSRFSTHGAMTGPVDNQVLANVLWAAAKTPLLAKSRTIYAALTENVYLYDPVTHTLSLQTQGKNLLSDPGKMAFEIGIATTPENVPEDAGAALHWAQLASVSFWGTAGSKPIACCPRDSGSINANDTWKPTSEIHLVNCYGSGTTASFKTELVAKSSDKSLPDPITDSKVILEKAITAPLFGDNFDDTDLTDTQISQLAWAAYGATPHSIGNKSCVTVASHGASFYLQGKIYIVTSQEVSRFSSRNPSGSESSKDHRIEKVTSGDKRSGLRGASPKISTNAPVYFVICAEKAERPQLLDAGFSGASALIQATALGLQGHYCASLSSSERSSIQAALGIPTTDIPLLVFASGKQKATNINHTSQMHQFKMGAYPNPFDKEVCIEINSGISTQQQVIINDIAGREIRNFGKISSSHNAIQIKWDGRNNTGVIVPSGTYVCNITARDLSRSLLIYKK